MDIEADRSVWFLLRIGKNEYAIQYDGPNPETEFPVNIEGYHI